MASIHRFIKANFERGASMLWKHLPIYTSHTCSSYERIIYQSADTLKVLTEISATAEFL
jgi:hypothetical protein